MDYLTLKLGDSAFCQPYCKEAGNYVVDTFHVATLDRRKDKIVEILKSATQASVKLLWKRMVEIRYAKADTLQLSNKFTPTTSNRTRVNVRFSDFPHCWDVSRRRRNLSGLLRPVCDVVSSQSNLCSLFWDSKMAADVQQKSQSFQPLVTHTV